MCVRACMRFHASVRDCVRVCAAACLRAQACARACVRACVCVSVCARADKQVLPFSSAFAVGTAGAGACALLRLLQLRKPFNLLPQRSAHARAAAAVARYLLSERSQTRVRPRAIVRSCVRA